jgi:hypothetical protein
MLKSVLLIFMYVMHMVIYPERPAMECLFSMV